MEKNPKSQSRGIGDNSSFGEWASAYLDDAVAYIVKLTKKSARLEQQINKAIYGKNNLQRGVALSEAKKINDSINRDAKVFEPVLKGIHNREDIHSGELKGHKLDMCAKSGNFGNYIANTAGGKDFDRTVDNAFYKADIEDQSDED
jgi:hypothetical protein|tara:strand:+ start:103 stop:540 length:438 start_codon:yes stop_codon:yes gene_type:complete